MSIDWSSLASVLSSELDDMLVRRDYICVCCGLSNDVHYLHCPMTALLKARRDMVPMIVAR